MKKKDLSKYSKLDENGFVKENTFVDHNDAFVAKCTLNKTEDGDFSLQFLEHLLNLEHTEKLIKWLFMKIKMD